MKLPSHPLPIILVIKIKVAILLLEFRSNPLPHCSIEIKECLAVGSLMDLCLRRKNEEESLVGLSQMMQLATVKEMGKQVMGTLVVQARNHGNLVAKRLLTKQKESKTAKVAIKDLTVVLTVNAHMIGIITLIGILNMSVGKKMLFSVQNVEEDFLTNKI